MTEMGALGGYPSDKGFDPDSDWEHIYRIWSSYGYWHKNNKNDGWLKITRRVIREGGTQILNVKQLTNNATGRSSEQAVFNVIEAEVTCRLDQYAAPQDWTFASRFIYEDDHEKLPQSGLSKTGRIADDKLIVNTNGQERTHALTAPVASNWSLFEAVQRLPSVDHTALDFTYLEDLSMIKEGHKISYQGLLPSVWRENKIKLHRFQHTGSGIFPFEYWLNSDHKLLLAVTGPRAYILDDMAEHIFDESHPAIVEMV